MSPILNLTLFVILLIVIAFVSLSKSKFTGVFVKVRKAGLSPWNLHEFLLLKPNRRKHNEFFRFNEETVRSHAHRFLGRFDTAILHWEEAPILDVMIERKFPMNNIPEKVKDEDIFQASLYTLALSESGVSCSQTKLVIIYCLQDTAKRCLEGNSSHECVRCSYGKIFHQQYNERYVRKQLKKLDEIWYNQRRPRPAPSRRRCGSCPYSRNGACNYSAV